MMGVVAAVRRIQINKIAYHPHLFKALINKETHPTEHDESDDTELGKEGKVYHRTCDFYGKPTYTGFHKYLPEPTLGHRFK
jgi:hypothetical protein